MLLRPPPSQGEMLTCDEPVGWAALGGNLLPLANVLRERPCAASSILHLSVLQSLPCLKNSGTVKDQHESTISASQLGLMFTSKSSHHPSARDYDTHACRDFYTPGVKGLSDTGGYLLHAFCCFSFWHSPLSIRVGPLLPGASRCSLPWLRMITRGIEQGKSLEACGTTLHAHES